MAQGLDPVADGRGSLLHGGADLAGAHPLEHVSAGGDAESAARFGQRAHGLGAAPVAPGADRGQRHYLGGAGSRADPERLAEAGHLGLLPPAGQPVGAGVPEVRPAVGGAGGDRHRAVRLDAALAVPRGAAPLPLDLRGGMQDRNGGALRADRRGGYRTGGWGGIPLPEECQAGRCPGGAPGYGEQAGYGSDVRHLFVVPDHGQKVGGSTYQRRRGGGHACSGDGPHGVYRLRPQRGGPQRQ